jgi:hypothetical protein
MAGRRSMSYGNSNIPEVTFSELPGRGPDRTWHRYVIPEEGSEVLENDENRQEERCSCQFSAD